MPVAADPPPAEQAEGEKVVLTLKELAAQFGFADPQAFRRAVLDRGRIWFRRISRSRFEVLVAELPS